MNAKYALEDLLRVRKLREDRAINELAKRRDAVRRAEALVAQRRNELNEYIEWRGRREEELYGEVMRRPIQLRKLDDLKQDVSALREREAARRQQVLEAEKALTEAQTSMDEARAKYQAAFKNREKIDEHKGMWGREAAKAAEAEQEKELEDFRSRSLDGEQMHEETYDV